MLEVNVREARQRLSRLPDEVERGGEVQITRHGKVAARLIPHGAVPEPERVFGEAAALREHIGTQHGVRDNPILTEREEAPY